MLDYKVCVTFYFANQNAAQQARIDAVYFVSPLFCHQRAGLTAGLTHSSLALIKVSNLPLCAQLGPHTHCLVSQGALSWPRVAN